MTTTKDKTKIVGDIMKITKAPAENFDILIEHNIKYLTKYLNVVNAL